MKKIFTLLLLLASTSVLFANPVSLDQARSIANQIMARSAKKSSLALASAYSKDNNGVITYHVFNYSGGGFVIVAADDAVYPVLANSDQGLIDATSINPELQYFLDGYNRQIAAIVAAKLDNTETKKAWDAVFVKSAQETNVGPLCTTLWNQNQYYNYYCPAATGGPVGKCYAGCVATAMGQIMKYHNFPPQGVLSHEYTHPDYGKLSADFGSTNYNFANMGNSANNSSYQEIATLLYHAGVAVDMNYGPKGSGAFSPSVPYALANYFNYNASSLQLVSFDDIGSAEFQRLLKLELDGGRPVYYSGSSGESGHAWVCDGYSGDMFHMNWGWSGSGNGNFRIGSLNPSGSQFNSDNAMIIGITPGNPNLIIRFKDIYPNDLKAQGETVAINGYVYRGTAAQLNLYIDNKLVTSSQSSAINYSWNTAGEKLGKHVIKFEAKNGTDNVSQTINIGISEWQPRASSFANSGRGIHYLHAVDTLKAWSIARDGNSGGLSIAEFARTADGGNTWTNGTVVTYPNYGLGNISGVDENTAFATVFSGGSAQSDTCGVYKTIDGGKTWKQLPTALRGKDSFADNVIFWDANEGMSHGDVRDNYFEIYTTADGGNTWTRVPQANIGAGAAAQTGEGGWTSVIETTGKNTVMFGTNKANLYISDDRGKTWRISNTGITPASNGGINMIAFKDVQNGLVAQTASSFSLKETHDGGKTWQTITPVGPFLKSDIKFVPGTQNTYVSVGYGGASCSFDGGYSWAQFPGTEFKQFISVDFFNDHFGLAGGYNESATEGGAFRYVRKLQMSSIPSPATKITITAQEYTANITWTAPQGTPTNYHLYRNDTLIATLPGTTLTYTDKPVASPQQTYCIQAVYPIGDSPKTCGVKEKTIVGINDPAELKGVSIYPNPATEVIHVFSPEQFVEVAIFNSLGQQVYRNPNKDSELHILTQGFKPGMYIIQIRTKDKIARQKITVQ